MGLKRCLACADPFETSARVPAQNYCNRPECQRERRRLWQREKRQEDADYRANQLQCQQRWRENHAEYWQRYRDEHPDYVRRNRAQQRTRNASRPSGVIAKMDAITSTRPLPSGVYHLRLVGRDGVAKMDAWIARITLLTSA